jgi:hypothetical protein
MSRDEVQRIRGWAERRFYSGEKSWNTAQLAATPLTNSFPVTETGRNLVAVMADPRNWKHFERLVAAVHAVASKGAQVRWDDRINGRQFDVTIRFKQGLYYYLTVVECKNYAKPVAAEKVESLVTKSRDAGAHLTVLASSSGFQEGARQVAAKHNITLIHVTESEDVDVSGFFGAHWAGDTDCFHVQSIVLEYVDGEVKNLPEQAHAMAYYAKHIILSRDQDRDRECLRDLIQRNSMQLIPSPTHVYQDYEIPCPEGTSVIAPCDGEIPLKFVATIRIRAGLDRARVLAGPIVFEPYLVTPDVRMKDVLTGDEQKFPRYGLPLGVGTKVREGIFYENPNLAMYYTARRSREKR